VTTVSVATGAPAASGWRAHAAWPLTGVDFLIDGGMMAGVGQAGGFPG
jgi:hypothetical protein